MLLNTVIEVVVTNDGKNNNVSQKADLNLKLQDVLTSLRLAEKAYLDMLTIYIRSKYPEKLSSKKIDKIYSEITLQDIFDFSQKEAFKFNSVQSDYYKNNPVFK